jgi:hypothetical protein
LSVSNIMYICMETKAICSSRIIFSNPLAPEERPPAFRAVIKHSCLFLPFARRCVSCYTHSFVANTVEDWWSNPTVPELSTCKQAFLA